MPEPHGPPRRVPPSATGRQDRHGPRPLRTPPPEEGTLPPAGPRGMVYYEEGRSKSYGLGCLIMAAVAAAGLAAVLLAVALVTAEDDFGPAASTPAAAPVAAAPEAEAPASGDAD